jgi:hypothetical protein
MEYQRFPCPHVATQKGIDALPKLNPTAKKVWVDALLSGKYPQGQNLLRSEQGYCCLGVACDLFDKKGWEPVIAGMSYDYTGYSALLPPAVAGWLGLDRVARDVRVYYKGKPTYVSTLNDRGVPFDMIAGLIINQL